METEYNFVECRQLDTLQSSHPLLHRLVPKEDHYPASFLSLRTCPDVYSDFPCCFYLQTGDRIVASVAAFPDTFTFESRSHPCAWGASFLTSRDCRGHGLARRLWAATARTFNERGITLFGAFTNPVMTRLSGQLGFTIPERIPRLLFLRSARPFLSHQLPSVPLVSLLDAPYRVIASGLRVLTRASRPLDSSLTLEIVEEAHRLEEHQGTATPEYGGAFHFNDDCEKFLWKFAACRDSRVYLIKDRSSGEVLVRFVLKNRRVTGTFAQRYTGFRLMTLMDYVIFGNPERSIRALADAAMRLFWESDAEVFESVSASPVLNAHLKRKLMMPIGEGVAHWFKAPPGISIPPDALLSRNWHFTHFCADGFSFG